HELYAKGYIGFEEALAGATNRDEFILRIRGVQSSADQAREELARSFRADDQVNRY
ncbi:MAG: hypothetical protein JNM06_22995, partial [Blastocatellia bacterium]|nr:hypothetical protein [Blastocatellia bacterium]